MGIFWYFHFHSSTDTGRLGIYIYI